MTRLNAFIIGSTILAASPGCHTDTLTPEEIEQAAGDAAQRFGLSIVGIRLEDRDNAKTRVREQSMPMRPCPAGGNRTLINEDTILLEDCGVMPGFVMNGQVKIVEDDTDQDLRIEFINLRGTYGMYTYVADGFIEEKNNPDGSLTFAADFKASTTELYGETDITEISGNLTISSDGTMLGGFTLGRGSLVSPLVCTFDGQNVFTTFNDPRTTMRFCTRAGNDNSDDGVTLIHGKIQEHVFGSGADNVFFQPLAGVKVTVYDRETDDVLGTATSGSDGIYTIMNVPAFKSVYAIASKASYADYGLCFTADRGPLPGVSFEGSPFYANLRPANDVCVSDTSKFVIRRGDVRGNALNIHFGVFPEFCQTQGEIWINNPTLTPYSHPDSATICVSGNKSAPTFHWKQEWFGTLSKSNADRVAVYSGSSPVGVGLESDLVKLFEIHNFADGIDPPIKYGDTSRGDVQNGADGSTPLVPGETYEVRINSGGVQRTLVFQVKP